MTTKENQKKIEDKEQNSISLESSFAELKDLLKSINNSIINGNLALTQTINNGNNLICQMINNLPNQISSHISTQISSQNEMIFNLITNGNNQILDALKMKENSNGNLKQLSFTPSNENSEENKNSTDPKINKNITKENNSSSSNGDKKKHTSLIKTKQYEKKLKRFKSGNLNLTKTNYNPDAKKSKINKTTSIPIDKRNNKKSK